MTFASRASGNSESIKNLIVPLENTFLPHLDRSRISVRTPSLSFIILVHTINYDITGVDRNCENVHLVVRKQCHSCGSLFLIPFPIAISRLTDASKVQGDLSLKKQSIG